MTEQHDPALRALTWTCRITGPDGVLPSGADLPMRQAIRAAYLDVTGNNETELSSGWGEIAALAAAEAAPLDRCQGVCEYNDDPHYHRAALRSPDTETVHEPSGIGVSNAIAGERHCTGCGEPWPCLTYQQGRAIVKAVLPSIARSPDTETAERP